MIYIGDTVIHKTKRTPMKVTEIRKTETTPRVFICAYYSSGKQQTVVVEEKDVELPTNFKKETP